MADSFSLRWVGHYRIIGTGRRDCDISNVQDSCDYTEKIELFCRGKAYHFE
jgi:hypothetical protein